MTFTSALILLSFLPLSGKETVRVKDHEYPVQYESQSVKWRLRGTEHFRYKVVFSVFTAAYYKQIDGNGKVLRFTYTRSLKAKDLREQAMKTLRNQNSEQTLKEFEELTGRIQSAYEDVSDGDAYTITVIPGQGTWLHRNDQEVFFTENAGFGEWYLNIWLGDPPISADLKTALTQGPDS
ncbi:MAG: chalcone isomerase family protein [Kiritimatiellia bacterium]